MVKSIVFPRDTSGMCQRCGVISKETVRKNVY